METEEQKDNKELNRIISTFKYLYNSGDKAELNHFIHIARQKVPALLERSQERTIHSAYEKINEEDEEEGSLRIFLPFTWGSTNCWNPITGDRGILEFLNKP